MFIFVTVITGGPNHIEDDLEVASEVYTGEEVDADGAEDDDEGDEDAEEEEEDEEAEIEIGDEDTDEDDGKILRVSTCDFAFRQL